MTSEERKSSPQLERFVAREVSGADGFALTPLVVVSRCVGAPVDDPSLRAADVPTVALVAVPREGVLTAIKGLPAADVHLRKEMPPLET